MPNEATGARKSASHLVTQQQSRLAGSARGQENQDADQHEQGRHQNDERPHLLVSLERQQSLLKQGRHVCSEERLGTVDAQVFLFRCGRVDRARL